MFIIVPKLRALKYDKDHIDKIIQVISKGEGRVRACEAAGVHYSTFIDWMENKPEFSEKVKKAESVGMDAVKEMCKQKIINDASWQSSAWWLERNYPTEFRNRQELDHNGDGIIINLNKK